MGYLIRNKTYNNIFEISEDPNNFYLLNINNDYYTKIPTNPYFGEITLMSLPSKPYMKDQLSTKKESKGSIFFRES